MLRRTVIRSAYAFASVILTTTVLTAPLLAQDEPTGPQDKSSWVLGYALVILGIVLGLVAVCRPGNRSADVRIDDE